MLELAGERIEVLRTVFRAMAFPRHTHDYYAIGVGFRGVGSIWYRGASHVRRRGDVVVIPPGEVHTGGVGPRSSVLSYLAAYVPASLIDACAKAEGTHVDTMDFRSPVFQDATMARSLSDLAGLLPSSSGRADAAPVAQDALACALSSLVRRKAGEGSARQASDDPKIVRTARDVIQSCYADSAHTSLAALASATGVTTFHVTRAFTRATGLSPHHYLLQVRVERARRLLSAGMSPSLVASMTGFVDQSHLTTQFKRYLGITPGRYQRGLGV